MSSRSRVSAVGTLACLCAFPARASFHLVQIGQVVGGAAGNAILAEPAQTPGGGGGGRASAGTSPALAEPSEDESDTRQGGEFCLSPFVISSLPFNDTGNTAAAQNNHTASCVQAGSSGRDVVYRYTPSTNQIIDISLCAGTGFDAVVYVFNTPDCTAGSFVTCDDDGCGTVGGPPVIRNLTLTAGVTYSIVIDGWSTAASGSYQISITPVAPGACCRTDATCLDSVEAADCNGLGEFHFPFQSCGSIGVCPPVPSGPACGPASDFGPGFNSAAYSFANTSDEDAPASTVFTVYEGFWALTRPISTIRWWGIEWHYDGTQFDSACDKADTFEIIFYADNGNNAPDLNAPLFGPYLVQATAIDTGVPFNLGANVQEFTATLPTAVPLDTGWIAIVGQTDPSVPDCFFLWVNNAEPGNGDDRALQQQAGGALGVLTYDMSLCLVGGPQDACSQCGSGPHWIHNPPCQPGLDQMHTTASVKLDLNFDCLPDTTLSLAGPVSVERSTPQDDSATHPGTRPIDGHLDVIETEMISLSLTGSGALLTAGAGLGALPLQPTRGTIAEQPGDPSLADSFFDVFFEVDLGGGNRLYNQQPLRVDAVIDCVPPRAIYAHPDQCVPLFTSPFPGQGVPMGNLISATHTTGDPPECVLSALIDPTSEVMTMPADQVRAGTPILFCNTGPCPFDWLIAGAPPWATFSPTSGNLAPGECVLPHPPAISVTFDSTGLAPGKYEQNAEFVLVCKAPCPAGVSAVPFCVGLTVTEPIGTGGMGFAEFDLWETNYFGAAVSFQDFAATPIPAGFFEAESEAFTGLIDFMGRPIDGQGSGDTIIARSEDPVFPPGPFPKAAPPVEIMIDTLNLRSVNPIRVAVGDLFERWHVDAGVDGVAQTLGTLSAVQYCAEGGTFDSSLPIKPKLTFRRVSDPAVQVRPFFSSPEIVFSTSDGSWVVEPPPGLEGRMTIYQNPGFVPGVEYCPSAPRGDEPFECRYIVHGAVGGMHVVVPGKIKKPPCEPPIITCPLPPGREASGDRDEPVRGGPTPITLPVDMSAGPPHDEADTLVRGESQPAPRGPDSALGYRVEAGALYVNGFVTVSAGPPEIRYELIEVSAPYLDLDQETLATPLMPGDATLSAILRQYSIRPADQGQLFFGSLATTPVAEVFRAVADFRGALGGSVEVLEDRLPLGPDEGLPIATVDPADVLDQVLVVRGVIFDDGRSTFLTGPTNLVGAVSRKTGTVTCDLPADPVAARTSEPRTSRISELVFTYDAPAPGAAVTIHQDASCPAPPAYVPYAGTSSTTCTPSGNNLVCTFTPALENARAYRFTVPSGGGTVPVELRGLIGDINGDGRVNGLDRSMVVGVWTGPGFSCVTDVNGDGATNALDRSVVVSAWTGPQNCAP